jgi:hypothetical protein
VSDQQYRDEYDEYQQGEQDAYAELADDQAQPGNGPYDAYAPFDALRSWAETGAPDANSWSYEGPGSGGEVLACYGAFPYYGNFHTVRMHLHPLAGGRWVFGSLWAEGLDDVSVNIDNDLGSRALLTPVADAWWPTISGG